MGATPLAAQLLNRHRRRLLEVAGRPSTSRVQELQELQSIALPQHVNTSSFAKQARQSKCTLRLCTYSFELVMHYLQGHKIWLMLGLVNEAVRFEVSGSGKKSRRGKTLVLRSNSGLPISRFRHRA